MPTHGHCGTSQPDKKSYQAVHTPEYWKKLEGKDSGNTLYIDTRWIVLYANEAEKISTARVQDCLKMLNMVYSNKNTDELAKIPNTAKAPWLPLVATPNIQFLPLDSSTLKVEYKQITGNLDGTSPVEDASEKGNIIDGVLNIYIGNTGAGSILGQAEIASNIVYALYSSVGGYEVPGTLSNYQLGKTVVHEIGHAFSLIHTFQDSVCDGVGAYPDIPEQIEPNFVTALYETSPGVWEQKNDNRYTDLTTGSHLSCLSIQSDPNTAVYEMGTNYMDYGTDSVALMFTPSQVSEMRDYLQSSANTTLTLKSASDTSISSTGTTPANATSSSDGGLSTGAIIGIVVGSVVGVIIIIALMYYSSKHYKAKEKAASHAKYAESYVYKAFV